MGSTASLVSSFIAQSETFVVCSYVVVIMYAAVAVAPMSAATVVAR